MTESRTRILRIPRPARSVPVYAAILILLLGALVPLRYLVLNNHSYMHVFFTYRAMASAILAMLAALWLQIRPDRAGKERKKRR